MHTTKRIDRRAVLKGAAACLVLVAGSGVYRAVDQGVFATGEGPAYEPWANWREAEGPMGLVSAAVLAANPHNSQPWLFRADASAIDLYADRARGLGAMDPFLREMHIGLGCALENLVLAAEANGYAHQLTLMPDDTDTTHVASIDLSAGPAIDSDLHRAIPERRTDRAAYDERPVGSDTLEALGGLNGDEPEVDILWLTAGAERQQMGDLIVRATEAIIADEEQTHDSHRWLRHDWDALQQARYRDGVTIDTSGDSPLTRAAAKLLPSPSADEVNGYWLDGTRRQVGTAAAFGVITVGDGWSNAQRMQVGRLWQRMHLWATHHGLAMQPLNQIHERVDREAQLGIEPAFTDALAEIVGTPDRLPHDRRAAQPAAIRGRGDHRGDRPASRPLMSALSGGERGCA